MNPAEAHALAQFNPAQFLASGDQRLRQRTPALARAGMRSGWEAISRRGSLRKRRSLLLALFCPLCVEGKCSAYPVSRSFMPDAFRQFAPILHAGLHATRGPEAEPAVSLPPY